MRALQVLDAHAEFRFWGGDHMLSVAPNGLVKHIKDLAFMGFIEVLLNLKTILSNLRFCKQDILAFQPDAVIFIDYPGFNLRMAEFCKKNGLRTFYYISPQIWAWKENRINIIKKYIDRMYVILPFEEKFYTERGFNQVMYVGHPLLDEINKNESFARSKNSKQIAVLPGSRVQEIRKMLPVMSQVSSHFPDYNFVICGVNHIPHSEYKKYLSSPNMTIQYGQTYEILQSSSAAIVTSGTATLETALFEVPQVVCYKANPLSYWIAKSLVNIKYISLVNLILDKPAISELIQHNCNVEYIVTELKKLLWHEDCRDQIMTDYKTLKKLLGGSGTSDMVAKNMISYML